VRYLENYFNCNNCKGKSRLTYQALTQIDADWKNLPINKLVDEQSSSHSPADKVY